MSELEELEKTPQVIAYKAELAKALTKVEKKQLEEARVRKIFAVGEERADLLHHELCEELWRRAGFKDSTEKQILETVLQYTKAFEEVTQRLE